MSTNSTPILNGSWRSLPAEAKQILLAKLKAKRSTSLELPPLHPAQQQIISEARRFNVLSCGRRFGKTWLGIELAAQTAIEGFPVGWFAPTYKLLSEAWRDANRLLFSVIASRSVQQHRLEFNGGGSLDMWSLDSPDSSRGRKYKRVIIDEAAMIPNLEEAWTAAIYPTLTDFVGDGYWLSTPRGMNYFKHGFDKGQDPLEEDWASWSFPTSVNPHIPDLEQTIENARRDLPELTFKQEYLAEFLQSEGAVFRNIDSNLIDPKDEHGNLVHTPEKHKGHRVVQGVDWAQKEDFTVVCSFCCTCKTEVDLDRFNKIEWAFQRGRLRAAYDRWGVTFVLAEENSIGSPNIEALQREGMIVAPFQTTSVSKAPLIQSLALALERNEAKWLKIPVATAELVAYEAKVSAVTGRISYSAPEGMHDDTVMARALAWYVDAGRNQMFYG